MSIYLRDSIWWAYLVINGKRVRRSLKTGDLEQAKILESKLRGFWSEREPLEKWLPNKCINKMVVNAGIRARKRGIACDITREDILRLAKRSGGFCEVSYVPFSSDKRGHIRGPFTPSLDRIEPSGPYTFPNVRLVASSVNMAMQGWGPVVIQEISYHFALKARHTIAPQAS